MWQSHWWELATDCSQGLTVSIALLYFTIAILIKLKRIIRLDCLNFNYFFEVLVDWEKLASIGEVWV